MGEIQIDQSCFWPLNIFGTNRLTSGFDWKCGAPKHPKFLWLIIIVSINIAILGVYSHSQTRLLQGDAPSYSLVFITPCPEPQPISSCYAGKIYCIPWYPMKYSYEVSPCQGCSNSLCIYIYIWVGKWHISPIFPLYQWHIPMSIVGCQKLWG